MPRGKQRRQSGRIIIPGGQMVNPVKVLEQRSFFGRSTSRLDDSDSDGYIDFEQPAKAAKRDQAIQDYIKRSALKKAEISEQRKILEILEESPPSHYQFGDQDEPDVVDVAVDPGTTYPRRRSPSRSRSPQRPPKTRRKAPPPPHPRREYDPFATSPVDAMIPTPPRPRRKIPPPPPGRKRYQPGDPFAPDYEPDVADVAVDPGRTYPPRRSRSRSPLPSPPPPPPPPWLNFHAHTTRARRPRRKLSRHHLFQKYKQKKHNNHSNGVRSRKRIRASSNMHAVFQFKAPKPATTESYHHQHLSYYHSQQKNLLLGTKNNNYHASKALRSRPSALIQF